MALITLVEAVEMFLRSRRRKFASDSTLRWYSNMLVRLVAQVGWKPLDTLRLEDTWKFLESIHAEERDQRIQRETTRDLIRSTKTFLRWSIHTYHLDPSLVDDLHLPKPLKSPPKAVEMWCIKRVLDAQSYSDLGLRNRALIYFLLGTGCRAGGLIRLRPEHIDILRRVAVVTEKGGKTRPVGFGHTTAKWLGAWLVRRPRGAQTVFCSLRPRDQLAPLTGCGLTLLFRKMCQRARLPEEYWFSPHDLRHTFATAFVRMRGPAAILQAQLGHEDFRTTQRYLDVDPATLSQTVNVFDPVRELEKLYELEK